MKGIQLGYDQLDNGEKIYAKIPLNFYVKFINKITKQNISEEKSFLNFYKFSSSSGNKYAFKFKNFFYFKLNQETLNNNNKKRNSQNNMNNNNNINDNKILDKGKLESDKTNNKNIRENNFYNNNSNDIIKDKIYRINLELAKNNKLYKF